MEKLMITSDDLSLLAYKLGEVSDKLRQDIDEVTILLQELNTSLNGDIFTPLEQRAVFKTSECRELSELLINLSETLQKTARNYQTAEDQLVSHILLT